MSRLLILLPLLLLAGCATKPWEPPARRPLHALDIGTIPVLSDPSYKQAIYQLGYCDGTCPAPTPKTLIATTPKTTVQEPSIGIVTLEKPLPQPAPEKPATVTTTPTTRPETPEITPAEIIETYLPKAKQLLTLSFGIDQPHSTETTDRALKNARYVFIVVPASTRTTKANSITEANSLARNRAEITKAMLIEKGVDPKNIVVVFSTTKNRNVVIKAL